MNGNSRDKIFKAWATISEAALIKEVATKGEHVDLCIEYWAKRRKMSLEDYRLFFQDVVQTYVYRLLTERLVCKAETVLRNVQRNVFQVYYQFACECGDTELRDLVLGHLKRKEPEKFVDEANELNFYWDLLQQLHQCPTLLKHYKSELHRINLETLMNRDETFRKRLMIELYFEKRNSAILAKLNKFAIWDYFTQKQNMSELVRWCVLNKQATNNDTISVNLNELELKYCQWSVETEMFEYALKTLQNPNEVLRNCFAQHGFFFGDEHLEISKVVNRVCTTQSFGKNCDTLSRLSMGEWILKRDYVILLSRDYVSMNELKELIKRFPDYRKQLELIKNIRENCLQEREGFEKIAHFVKIYLEDQGIDLENKQPLVILYDFLCNESTISALRSFLNASVTKTIPYLESIAFLNETCSPSASTENLPTAYDLLNQFKGLDFRLMTCRDTTNVASFTNQNFCQKYVRNYNLNFLHYLNQQRSCFSIYYILTNSLKQYGQISKTHLFSAAETVTELALQNANNFDLLTHYIAFNEMLGFDTQDLRNFLKLHRLLPETSTSSINFSTLMDKVEEALIERSKRHPYKFPLSDYQALMRIVACNHFKKWPLKIMQHYAKLNDWWKILVLMQYFNLPLKQLQQIVPHFSEQTIGDHLLRALSQEPTNTTVTNSFERYAKRINSSSSRQQKSTRRNDNMIPLPASTSTSTMTSSFSSYNDINIFHMKSSSNQLRYLLNSSGNLDLFAIIIISTSSMPEEHIGNADRFLELMQDNHSYSTSVNLMKNSIKFRQPILSLLAATLSPLNIDWNWVMWLAVATDQWPIVERLCLQDVNELVWTLVENCVRSHEVDILHRSISIFFESNPLIYLTRFLRETTHQRHFNNDSINDLRFYFLAWSNDEIEVPLCNSPKREQIMIHSIKLLLVHLQNSLTSALDQRRLLQCICKSGISDISNLIDFCLLNEVFDILQLTPANINQCLNFEDLLQNEKKTYEQIIETLMACQEYNVAIRLSALLHLPVSDKVYTKWVERFDKHAISFEQYEDEIREYSLPPELLVNFFLYAASRPDVTSKHKYLLLKQALTVIKKNHLFPNECFDRDQIEYEMVLCYLQLSDSEYPAIIKLDLYHSEYFEEIMLKERCVLYKSFLELKELAGIDDLSVSQRATSLTVEMKIRLEALLNRLLDEGDIVEALRIQELFEYRPLDLRFVVFCMALAEGVTTIFSMSLEERQMLREIGRKTITKFNKRTLETPRSSGQSLSLRQNNEQLSDSSSTLDFEEIPPKEKRETLETIQGIVSRLKNGINIGTRIMKVYRTALYLDKEYLDVLRTKDITILLRSVADDSCMNKLLVVSDITASTQMTPTEIAELLAFEITTAIVRPRFYIFTADQKAKNTFKNAYLWGYNIDRDLHLILDLAPQTTILGNCLLDYCDALKTYRKFQDGKPYNHTIIFEKLSDIIASYGLPIDNDLKISSGMIMNQPTATTTPPQVLSHKKQNIIYVELLIKAHQCFVHECSMEGISNVLSRAKALNSVLVNAKSWSLIVRMLVGIARYREMFYCFDALIEHDQFESLLGQFEAQKTIVLRQAIITYLREYNPENGRELLKLAALHFLMYKELAEMWEQDAQLLITNILSSTLVGAALLTEQESMSSLSCGGVVNRTFIPKLLSSSKLIGWLQQALENYTHATENYLMDNKLLLAQRSASQAELMAMQIDLASKALENEPSPRFCVCVINVQTRDEFRELVNAELRVPQASILSRAYSYDINWAQAILSQFVILSNGSYLDDYLAHFRLNDGIIDNIVKGFQHYSQTHKTTAKMDEHLAKIIEFVKSITLKYKLASLMNMKSTVMSLLNDQSVYYLKDTNYGRNESHGIPEV